MQKSRLSTEQRIPLRVLQHEGISRRQLLMLAAAGAASGLLPTGCGDGMTVMMAPMPVPSYFTADERKLLSVFADTIFPPDDSGPGAAELGAVDFIENLLTAFDTSPPRIFVGGPFSGRAPYPRSDGSSSSMLPDDGFKNFIALTTVQERAWRLRLYGSAGVVGGGPNDALLGPVVGMRDAIRNGLQAASTSSTSPVQMLDDNAVVRLLDMLPPELIQKLTELVLQSLLAAPEYGGNRNLGGWKQLHFDGDRAPLGYSFYDTSSGTTKDRAGFPVSGPDTTADPEPLDADTLKIFDLAVVALHGRKFQ